MSERITVLNGTREKLRILRLPGANPEEDSELMTLLLSLVGLRSIDNRATIMRIKYRGDNTFMTVIRDNNGFNQLCGSFQGLLNLLGGF